jgi:hypothetical protein
VLWVHLPSDGPERTGAPLDPDQHPLGAAAVVAPLHDSFGEPPGDRRALHATDYTIASMGLRDALTGVFSFLGSGSQKEERIAQYVIREHHRGRTLAEILEDHYVTNRLSPEQVRRLIERQDVIHAIGEDTSAATTR